MAFSGFGSSSGKGLASGSKHPEFITLVTLKKMKEKVLQQEMEIDETFAQRSLQHLNLKRQKLF